jgi:hypothetical protein
VVSEAVRVPYRLEARCRREQHERGESMRGGEARDEEVRSNNTVVDNRRERKAERRREQHRALQTVRADSRQQPADSRQTRLFVLPGARFRHRVRMGREVDKKRLPPSPCERKW